MCSFEMTMTLRWRGLWLATRSMSVEKRPSSSRTHSLYAPCGPSTDHSAFNAPDSVVVFVCVGPDPTCTDGAAAIFERSSRPPSSSGGRVPKAGTAAQR